MGLVGGMVRVVGLEILDLAGLDLVYLGHVGLGLVGDLVDRGVDLVATPWVAGIGLEGHEWGHRGQEGNCQAEVGLQDQEGNHLEVGHPDQEGNLLVVDRVVGLVGLGLQEVQKNDLEVAVLVGLYLVGLVAPDLAAFQIGQVEVDHLDQVGILLVDMVPEVLVEGIVLVLLYQV